MKKKMDETFILNAGNVMQAQKHQLDTMEVQALQLKQSLNAMEKQEERQDSQLDQLLEYADKLEEAMKSGKEIDAVQLEDYSAEIIQPTIELSPKIEIDFSLEADERWKKYIESSSYYARLNGLDQSNDPYYGLMSNEEKQKFVQEVKNDYYEKAPKCDAVDYALAALSGTIAGIIDVFFVGMPGDSKIGEWTDKEAENFICKKAEKLWDKNNELKEKIVQKAKEEGKEKKEIARLLKENGYISAFDRKYSGKEGKPDRPQSVSEWIKFLESAYSVPYDETQFKKFTDYEGNSKIELTPANHHFLSLAHRPDLIGLIFSIIDQFFPEKTSFVVNGKIKQYTSIKVNSDAKLRGEGFVAKLFSGIVNWFNHCISDFCGSSTASGRGAGLANPGYGILAFFDVGSIPDSKNKGRNMTIAELACEVYQASNRTIEKRDIHGNVEQIKKESYDLRHGIAMMIPVMINDVVVRLFFAIRRHFFMGIPLKECLAIDVKIVKRQPELRRMFLISYGVLCIFDDADAVVTYIRTDCDVIAGVMHLNYYAQLRFAQIALAEIRAMHRRENIKLNEMIADVNREWEKLEDDAKKWHPYGL
jgi:hypothetical protein